MSKIFLYYYNNTYANVGYYVYDVFELTVFIPQPNGIHLLQLRTFIYTFIQYPYAFTACKTDDYVAEKVKKKHYYNIYNTTMIIHNTILSFKKSSNSRVT